MVIIEYTDEFKRSVQKIRSRDVKEKIKTQIRKIIQNPLIGKPMRYERKGTRELRVKPYRLAYAFDQNKIIFLVLYHKDMQ